MDNRDPRQTFPMLRYSIPEPAQTTQSVQPAQSTQPPQSAQTTQSVQPAQPAQPSMFSLKHGIIVHIKDKYGNFDKHNDTDGNIDIHELFKQDGDRWFFNLEILNVDYTYFISKNDLKELILNDKMISDQTFMIEQYKKNLNVKEKILAKQFVSNKKVRLLTYETFDTYTVHIPLESLKKIDKSSYVFDNRHMKPGTLKLKDELIGLKTIENITFLCFSATGNFIKNHGFEIEESDTKGMYYIEVDNKFLYLHPCTK